MARPKMPMPGVPIACDGITPPRERVGRLHEIDGQGEKHQSTADSRERGGQWPVPVHNRDAIADEIIGGIR